MDEMTNYLKSGYSYTVYVILVSRSTPPSVFDATEENISGLIRGNNNIRTRFVYSDSGWGDMEAHVGTYSRKRRTFQAVLETSRLLRL